MPQSRTANRSLLGQPLLWALVSAAGLLVAGAVGLWQAAAAADVLARDEARRTAEAGVRLLRQALGAPQLLAPVDAAARFTLADGRVVVPAELMPLDPPLDGESATALVPAPLRERVEEAENADGAAAPAAYEQALAMPGLSDPLRAWTLVSAAWSALRHGEPDRARALVADLDQCAGPHLPATLTGRALLAARLGLPVPDPILDALASAHPDRVAALTSRVRELGAAGLAVSLEQRSDTVATARRTLLQAQKLVSILREARQARLQETGQGLLLFQPAATAGEGSGALVTPAALAALLEQALGNDRPLVADRLTIGAAPAGEVVSADPLVHVRVLPATASAGGPRWLLPAGLGAVLVLALALSLRGLYRESAAVRTRAEFLTSVTHELKTPLASIRLLAELLDGDQLSGERRHEYHQLLTAESERLTSLVENVLDLGRMERGERAYDPQDVDGHDVVRQAVARFRPLAERNELQLELDADAAPALVRVDAGAFTQALLNVLDNARKYAAAGRRVQVSARADGESFAVRVRDFGPGLPVGDEERLFARFQRGRDQAAGTIPGVGLGLYLAREILRAQHGDLRHERPEGTGACFVFTLPLHSEATP